MSADVIKMTPKEAQLIQNIINKLNAYMSQTNQTLFSLAQTIGFAYQPFNSLMKKKNIPSLSSLAMLSDYLKCSIAELINDEFFIDVTVISSINKLPKLDSKYKSRIYIPYNEFEPLISKNFFILSDSTDNLVHKVYYLTNDIPSEGEYIVNYKNKYIFMNVLLTSSKFILIKKGDVEERIPTEGITPLAKFFKNVVMADSNENQIRGSVIFQEEI